MACAAAQCRKSDLPDSRLDADSTMTTRSQVTCHSKWAVHYPAMHHTWEVLSRTMFAVLDTQVGRPAVDVHVQLHKLAQTSTASFEYTTLGLGYVLNFPIWERSRFQRNYSTGSWAGRRMKRGGVRTSYRPAQRWKLECTS